MLIRSMRNCGLFFKPAFSLPTFSSVTSTLKMINNRLFNVVDTQIQQFRLQIQKSTFLEDLHILTVSTFRRKKTKVGKSKRKQKRKEMKRKSFKKQKKANV